MLILNARLQLNHNFEKGLDGESGNKVILYCFFF